MPCTVRERPRSTRQRDDSGTPAGRQRVPGLIRSMLAHSSLPVPDVTPRRSRIELCGALSAEIGGRRVDALLPGHKGRLLFACLVIGRHRPISRDELIDVIWPTDAPADPDG